MKLCGINKLDLDLIRKFRNFIHPNEELKNNLTPSKYDAEVYLKKIESIVSSLKEKFSIEEKSKNNIVLQKSSFPHAKYLALVCLIGSWDESNKEDIKLFKKFIRLNYEDWQTKAKDILVLLEVKNKNLEDKR